MDKFEQPPVDDYVELVKDAVRHNRLDRIVGVPEEAVFDAAVDGIVVHMTDLRVFGTSPIAEQSKIEMNARLELLDDEQRKQAFTKANDQLGPDLGE